MTLAPAGLSLRATPVAVALAAVAMASGCGGNDETTTVVPTTTATGTASTTTTATTATTTSTPAPAPVHLASFASPSGNIGCVMGPNLVRCDIEQADWQPPPRPSDCELDWGQAIEIDGRSAAEFVCAGDTTLGSEDTLGYGEVSEVGPFRCASAESGITCTDTRTRHAFSISRESYRLH